MERNNLSIPKLQRYNRWSLGMDKKFHPTFHWARDYLSMLGLKLIHVWGLLIKMVLVLQWLQSKYISRDIVYSSIWMSIIIWISITLLVTKNVVYFQYIRYLPVVVTWKVRCIRQYLSIYPLWTCTSRELQCLIIPMILFQLPIAN